MPTAALNLFKSDEVFGGRGIIYASDLTYRFFSCERLVAGRFWPIREHFPPSRW